MHPPLVICLVCSVDGADIGNDERSVEFEVRFLGFASISDDQRSGIHDFGTFILSTYIPFLFLQKI